MRKEVRPRVDGALVAEVIGEGRVVGRLVDIAEQGVGADRELSGLVASDQEAVTGLELAPALDPVRGFLGGRRRCRSCGDLGRYFGWLGWSGGRLRGCRWRRDNGGRGSRSSRHQELGAAPVRHPHSLVVVAPGLAQQASRRSPSCRCISTPAEVLAGQCMRPPSDEQTTVAPWATRRSGPTASARTKSETPVRESASMMMSAVVVGAWSPSLFLHCRSVDRLRPSRK